MRTATILSAAALVSAAPRPNPFHMEIASNAPAEVVEIEPMQHLDIEANIL